MPALPSPDELTVAEAAHILQLSPDQATDARHVQRAYRRAARHTHPDLRAGQSDPHADWDFALITIAYERLKTALTTPVQQAGTAGTPPPEAQPRPPLTTARPGLDSGPVAWPLVLAAVCLATAFTMLAATAHSTVVLSYGAFGLTWIAAAAWFATGRRFNR
ncbi:J domain-containing protein [Nonomuraea sp. NPDC050536]|uniref:J domain-containing protein n=1 Tax=Nonomuraea sp. NPDC050536 TaxID=3364366 RepID=UPI0037CBEED0